MTGNFRDMQKEFEKYLIHTCHCSPEKSYLLALSGGIDSVVMAHLFKWGGFDVAFAHCNFHLRGRESDEDQIFVENMATQLNVPCFVSHFNTRAYGESKGLSIQMAARDLRYEWFSTVSREHGYDYIGVGHNLNDLLETVLLNFARGCGIRGLTGIKPRQGAIVRPLLFASRQDILSLAREKHLTWREDSSNAETKYQRNRIRHKIIPEFEKINPSFLSNAIETVTRLNHTEQLFRLTVDGIRKSVWIELPDRYLIDIEKLKEYPATETVLFELLRDFSCSPYTVRSILSSIDSTPGKVFYTRTHCITLDRSRLIITPNNKPSDSEMWIDAKTALVSYPLHLTLNTFPVPKGYTIPTENRYAVLDAGSLQFPLKLRHWKPGDSFHPLGMQGSKKLSDFLIDNKVPLPDKQHVWVLESDENIVWVVNHRIDDRFRVTPDTRQVLLIDYKQIPSEANIDMA